MKTPIFAGLAFALMTGAAAAQTVDLGSLIPSGGASASGRIIEMVALLTVLSVAPGLLIMVTSFTRFIIALSFLRTGLGVQGAPANLVMISLALFMTFFVMAPTFDRAWQTGLKPMLANEISQQDALTAVSQPFREFMLSQVREKDIALFESLSKGRFEAGERSKVDFRLLIPAYMISELRRGFEIGFLVVLPFLVIDMIVATLTMSMGMMMLPPSVISLPVKVLFFVLVDGWSLLVGSLVRSTTSGSNGRQPRASAVGFKWDPHGQEFSMSILNTSVSGMSADQNWLASISQNVANANTTGYKDLDTDFSTMVDQASGGATAQGAGVQTSTVSLNALQGSVVSTQTATNLAAQGAGFFVVSNSAGNLYLTRNGSFVPDSSGNLVNGSGYYLMADNVQNGKIAGSSNSLSSLQKVNVESAGLTAEATTAGSLAVNLPSTAPRADDDPGPDVACRLQQPRGGADRQSHVHEYRRQCLDRRRLGQRDQCGLPNPDVHERRPPERHDPHPEQHHNRRRRYPSISATRRNSPPASP